MMRRFCSSLRTTWLLSSTPRPSSGGGASSSLHPSAQVVHHQQQQYHWQKHVKPKAKKNNLNSGSGAPFKLPKASEFEYISSLPALEPFVTNYLTQTKQQVSVQRVGSSWIAHMSLRTKEGKEFDAYGCSNSKKDSITLCRFHAGRLMDYSSTTSTSSSPMALPRPPTMKVIDQRAAAGASAKVAAPANGQFMSADKWNQYISQCEETIKTNKALETEKAHKNGEVQLTGDLLLDAAIFSAYEAPLDKSAPQRLTAWWAQQHYDANLLPQRWATKMRRRLSKLGYTISLTLPFHPFMKFTAVGDKSVVPIRAAMVMLRALKLAEKHIDKSVLAGGTGTIVSKKSSSAGETDPLEDVSISDDPDSVISHSPAERQRLIDLYVSCMGFPEVSPNFSFDPVSNLYVCALSVGELGCEGRGITRAESEHSARNAAYEELYRLDAEFREFGRIIRTHKRLDPSTIVQVDLPDDLRSRVLELTKDVVLEEEESTPTSTEDMADATSKSDKQGQVFKRRITKTMMEASPYRSKIMLQQLERRIQDPQYQEKFHQRRTTLAMHGAKEELLELIANNQVVVLCGTTGCGKTTQVPQYILDDAIKRGEGSDCSIVVTQPRRISAISIASRIAAERLQSVGQEVGYTIRLDAKPGSHINLVTNGVLLRIMSGDPSLSHIKYLILDEIHERDINCDFLIILVKRMLKLNKDIKIILMSATLASEKFSAYFGGAPVVNVDGLTYPVDVKYLGDIEEVVRPYGRRLQQVERSNVVLPNSGNTNIRSSDLVLKEPPRHPDYAAIATLVRHVTETGIVKNNSILVFLPGWGEMDKARKEISMLPNSSRYLTIMLHSSVNQADQMLAFNPAPRGKTKVVLATNIAESGITIDDVGVVIDAGMIKETHWILQKGTTEVGQNDFKQKTHLQTRWCSQANVTQRKGRAGRTQHGVCYRLYSERQFNRFKTFQVPEMLRESLEGVLLQALALGHKDPEQLLREGLDTPTDEALTASMGILRSLGAIDRANSITTLGKWLSLLPTTPRLGKMIILAATMRCLDPVLAIASTDTSNPFNMAREMEKQMLQSKMYFGNQTGSDQMSKVNAFTEWVLHGGSRQFATENNLNIIALNAVGRHKLQYFDVLKRSGFLPEAYNAPPTSRQELFVDNSVYSRHKDNISLVKACMCAGLFPNVAMAHKYDEYSKKGANHTVRLKMTDSISIDKKSVVTSVIGKQSTSPLLVYDQIFTVSKDRVNDMTVVSFWGLLLFGAPSHLIEHRSNVGLCVIDDWIMFKTSPETIDGILKLKKLLDDTIWQKLQYPNDRSVDRQLQYLQHTCREIVSLSIETRHKDFNTSDPEARVVWKDTGKLAYSAIDDVNPYHGMQTSESTYDLGSDEDDGFEF